MDTLIRELDDLRVMLDLPRFYLADFFLDLRNQVDIVFSKHLNLSNKSQKLWLEIIDRINEFEKECFKHFKFSSLNEQIKIKLLNDLECIQEDKNKMESALKMISNEKTKISKRLFSNQSILFIHKKKWKWIDTLLGGHLQNQLIILRDDFLSEENLRNISDSDFIFSNNMILINRVLNSEKLKLKLLFDKILESNSHIKEIQTNLDDLDMLGNRITSIDKETFIDMSNLKSLVLSYNYIFSINSEALNGLKHLKRLDLSHNKIKSFNVHLFKSLISLNELNLSYNPVDEFDFQILKNLTTLKVLKLVSLSIREIPKDSFKNMTNLEELNLNHNKMDTINYESYNGLTNLKVLILKHNQIKEIKENAFNSFRNLQSIDLFKNIIVSFDINSLIGLSNLSSINLDGNPINKNENFNDF